MKRYYRYTFKNFLVYFLVLGIIANTIAFLIFYYVEKELQDSELEELKNHERKILQMESIFFGREFSMVLSDLLYIHDVNREAIVEGRYEAFIKDWEIFVEQKRVYDQIRYIDARGSEKVRIDKTDDGAVVRDESVLQYKKNRYYVNEALRLPSRSVYISPMDLNVENGKVEEPYKPTIRFSMPIYDSSETVQGVIVLNLLGEYILSGVEQIGDQSEGEFFLLNKAGYALVSKEPENNWNFMFVDRREQSFKNMYPEIWNKIEHGEMQFLVDDGMVSVEPIDLSYQFESTKVEAHLYDILTGEDRWYAVTIVGATDKYREVFLEGVLDFSIEIFKHYRMFFVLILSVSTCVSYIIYSRRKAYMKIRYHSEIDDLTQVYNRRAGIELIEARMAKGLSKDSMISLCYIDINGLKAVNDTLGHVSGDALIITVASEIKSAIRRDDVVVRLGGDEFLLMLNKVPVTQAEAVWKRIVTRFDYINKTENRAYVVSVSHGIVEVTDTKKYTLDELLHIADEKMYEEKKRIKQDVTVLRDGSFVPESPKN